MLTRIYGTAFFKQKELEEHLERLEQARARDHRKLGRELDLFMLLARSSPGSPFWLPDGHGVYNELVALVARDVRARAATARSRRRRSTTSSCGRPRATGTSTARTCSSPRPRSAQIGAQADELPRPRQLFAHAAAGPTATCRSATPSRACCTATSRAARCTACCACATSPRTTRHIFCTEEQIQDEVAALPGVRLRRSTTSSASSRALELSTRPEKRIGTDELWDRAEARAGAGARATRGSSTTSTRATARSTGRRSTST